jgi:hypothetical protein
VKRWVLVAAVVLGTALALLSLREPSGRPPAVEEEIDDASKQALRDILQQENE